jgi:hypothetical protein
MTRMQLSPGRALAALQGRLGLLVALALQAVFIPWSKLTASIPSGGDVGAHVWLPPVLREALPFLHTYSQDWYGGVAVGFFYFPVPALSTALFDLLIPYGTAFKLTMCLAVLAVPAGAWRLARGLGATQITATAAALAAVSFATMRQYTIFGGNLASTAAGMFSYQLGLGLALAAAGTYAASQRTGTGRARAAVLIALAACTHVLAGVIVGVLCLAVFATNPNRRRALWTLVTAGALAACWWVPFLAYSPYTTSMRYEPIVAWRWLMPIGMTYPADQTAPTWHWYAVVPLAVVALVLWRTSALVRAAAVLAAFSAVCYLAGPFSSVWNVRWLPGYHLALFLLAAAALSAAANALTSPGAAATPPRAAALRADLRTRRAVAVFVAGVCAFPALHASGLGLFGMPDTPHPHRGWLAYDFGGYQEQAAWGEYHGVITALDELTQAEGCGRVAWEYDFDQGRYGTPMALQALPFWTDGCVESLEGLYFEASRTTPFFFASTPWWTKQPSRPVRDIPYGDALDMAKGLDALRSLGARWYATYHPDTTDAAREAGLREVAHSLHWTVFEVPNHGVVAELSAAPAAAPFDPAGYLDAFVEDPAAVLADWDPASYGLEPGDRLAPAGVSDVSVEDRRISFSVASPGVPVLVRASWFPGWRVSGAREIHHAGANMMLVVPDDTTVTLTWHKPVFVWVGYLTTLAGLAGLMLLRRRPHAPLPGPGRDPADDDHT